MKGLSLYCGECLLFTVLCLVATASSRGIENSCRGPKKSRWRSHGKHSSVSLAIRRMDNFVIDGYFTHEGTLRIRHLGFLRKINHLLF